LDPLQMQRIWGDSLQMQRVGFGFAADSADLEDSPQMQRVGLDRYRCSVFWGTHTKCSRLGLDPL
jgi:hypothetical protein